MTARTEATEARYQEAKKNGTLQPLDQVEPLHKWVYWRLVENEFPHDKLNRRHRMIVLNRQSDLWELTNNEIYELWRVILPELDKQYHYFKLNGSQLRSINNVPHIHVCDFLPEYV